jgi:hypothetical protein
LHGTEPAPAAQGSVSAQMTPGPALTSLELAGGGDVGALPGKTMACAPTSGTWADWNQDGGGGAASGLWSP